MTKLTAEERAEIERLKAEIKRARKSNAPAAFGIIAALRDRIAEIERFGL